MHDDHYDPERSRNAGTSFGYPSGLPVDEHDSFFVAYPAARRAAERAPGAVLVVVAVDSRGRLVGTATLADRCALIIGRHEECGLHLPHSSIALRHLALLPLDDSARTLTHVWDLNTGQPFLVEDQNFSSAVVAVSLKKMSVNEYSLWLFPRRLLVELPAAVDEAWRRMPTREVLDQRMPSEPPKRRPPPQRPKSSQISLRPATVEFGALAPAARGDACGAVGLGDDRSRVRRHVDLQTLQRGVLLGRYERCGVTLDDEANDVSRVHLLLVQIGEDLWAIDTASSNGVWRNDAPIRQTILSDRDTLRLAGSLEFLWRRKGA